MNLLATLTIVLVCAVGAYMNISSVNWSSPFVWAPVALFLMFAAACRTKPKRHTPSN